MMVCVLKQTIEYSELLCFELLHTFKNKYTYKFDIFKNEHYCYNKIVLFSPPRKKSRACSYSFILSLPIAITINAFQYPAYVRGSRRTVTRLWRHKEFLHYLFSRIRKKQRRKPTLGPRNKLFPRGELLLLPF